MMLKQPSLQLGTAAFTSPPSRRQFHGWLAAALGLMLGLACPSSQAQWLTQTNVIPPGWSAVYFNVNASGYGATLDQLVGTDPANPIVEIWQWQAASGAQQYVSNPQAPTSSAQWVTWLRSPGNSPNTLFSLSPNAAYLIHSVSSSNYLWRVQGKPAPPSYYWDITGLNLLGFSTPFASAPTFANFLAPATTIAGLTQLYAYQGGALGTNNPVAVSPLTQPVTRGQAFWIRATNINNTYFGPFQVVLSNPSGIDYGTTASQVSFHLQNETAAPLTVSAQLLPSETPPAGQPAIVGLPPLLVRGALNPTNLTYGFTDYGVTNSVSWTLAPQGQPGSDIVVTLGLNRSALTNSVGGEYAGFLQFTDSLGFSEVNIPVAAQQASTAGLWVGSASISQVGEYLKTYQTNADGSTVVGPNGNYVVSSINTNLGAVPTPYPIRLIIHNDGTNASLLQRVYYGIQNQGSNLVVATTESALDPAQLGTARRISASAMPWTAANTPWPFTGQLNLGGVLTTTVTTPYDDQAANPFLHTYHPDHNNLDPKSQTQLPQGSESYGISRQITLSVLPPATDFTSLTTANSSLSGTYFEAISLAGLGGATRTFNIAGNFTLTQISPIANLTTQ